MKLSVLLVTGVQGKHNDGETTTTQTTTTTYPEYTTATLETGDGNFYHENYEDCCNVWSVQTKGKKDKKDWECRHNKRYSDPTNDMFVYDCFEGDEETGRVS